MSRKTITKTMEATVCDFCDKEVETKSEEYCYAHIMSSDGTVREPSRIFNITHFVFSWLRNRTSAETWATANERPKWIRYDFHAECFHLAMKKLIADKEAAS